MKIEVNNKGILAACILSAGLAFGNFVSIVDAKSAGGIIVEEEQVPVGSIQMWGANNVPDGWLELNGQSTAGYPDLAAIYGGTLPDFRGRFIRAANTSSSGLDANRAVLSTQSQSVQPLGFKGNKLPDHSHNLSRGSQMAHKEIISAYGWGGDHGSTVYKSNLVTGASAGTPTGTITGTGVETRPDNISVKFIVKAE